MANAVAVEVQAPEAPSSNDASAPKPTALSLSTYQSSDYLTPGSDPVALLVLAHQTQMHNLITLTNYKTRIALYNASQPSDDAARQQFERPAEQLLRYLLFANETALTDLDLRKSLAGSPYAQEFAALGPRDSQGRSLRDFDLSQRIFRYPCSYLIYSDAFEALPEPAKGYVYHRLLQVLTGQDPGKDFANLSAQSRREVLEILLQTKQNLPAEWLSYAKSNHLKTSGGMTS